MKKKKKEKRRVLYRSINDYLEGRKIDCIILESTNL